MRLILLAAAATFVLTGTAMANESAQAKAMRHHNYRNANALAPAKAAPVDIRNSHETYMKSLRQSGYDPAKDHTAAGNMKTNGL